MRRGLLHVCVRLLSFAVFGAGGVAGFFAAAGFCAAVWGSGILDTALGNPPDRSHPAFWVFLLLTVPAMLVGFGGAFFLFVVPILQLSGVRLGVGKKPDSLTDWLEKYARWLDGIVSREKR